MQSILSFADPMDTTSRGCLCRSPSPLEPGSTSRSRNHQGGLDVGLSARLTPKRARFIRYTRPTHRREETLPDLQWILYRHARVSSIRSLTTHVRLPMITWVSLPEHHRADRVFNNYTAGLHHIVVGLLLGMLIDLSCDFPWVLEGV